MDRDVESSGPLLPTILKQRDAELGAERSQITGRWFKSSRPLHILGM